MFLRNVPFNLMHMKRRIIGFILAAACFIGLCAPAVRAEEMTAPYDPEDGKLTHLELLEKLCTGFPYVGYEKYPEVPQYFQQDYPDVPYGGYVGTVATHGCGITALAMLATYMTDTEMTPADLAGPFKRFGTELGTAYDLFDISPGVLGYYLEKRSKSLAEIQEALARGQMVISLQFADHFTTTAHFIVLTGITEEGKITVRDSNVFNHTRRFAGTDLLETGFDPQYVHACSRYYWIYEKKVVRVPGCTRCADPEVETAPVFLEPHYCTKCTALLNKQDTYHEIMGAIHEKPEI